MEVGNSKGMCKKQQQNHYVLNILCYKMCNIYKIDEKKVYGFLISKYPFVN